MEKELIKTYLSDDNMLITGGAGTGKSYWIRKLKELPDKRIVYLTASTGIAAENIGGMTIHSYVGSQGYVSPRDASRVTNLKTFKDAVKRICGTRVLIIDEVSMIRADYFELLNLLLCRARGNAEPFGGIKIVLVGDFMQLPPVYSEHDDMEYGKYVFQTTAFEEGNFKIFNLKEVKRQDDPKFIQVLNDLRFGILSDDSLALLKKQRNLENPIYLSGLNREVEIINQEKLNQLNGESIKLKTYFSYHPDYVNEKNRTKYWQMMVNDYKVPEEVNLKYGARVLITKNDRNEEYVNGSTGVIKDYGKFIKNTKKYEKCIEYLEDELGRERREYYKLTDEDIKYFKMHWDRRFKNGRGEFNARELCIIALDNGLTAYVERYETKLLQTPLDESDTQMVAICSASYFPLKLGWAITSHKSQGMTLDEVDVDAQGFFAEGMFYVSASRATSLEGLNIKNFDERKLLTCEIAKEFYEGLK